MKRVLATALLVMPVIIVASAQVSHSQADPPKKVIEKYFQMEANGGRLTSKGWDKASSFFVRPVRRPKDIQINVIYKEYSVWDPVISGSTAEITVGYLPVGQIDSALRYTPSRYIKGGVAYRLTLTDKHWEPGHVGEPAKEVAGALEWRIEGPASIVWITRESAIKYVKEMRDKSKDPVIRTNADKTLKVLEMQQRPR